MPTPRTMHYIPMKKPFCDTLTEQPYIDARWQTSSIVDIVENFWNVDWSDFMINGVDKNHGSLHHTTIGC
jgi:hypothetical protein